MIPTDEQIEDQSEKEGRKLFGEALTKHEHATKVGIAMAKWAINQIKELGSNLYEYTEEEKKACGNQMYGGKRHDVICDQLIHDGYSEDEVVLVSVGIWKGIESERAVSEARHQEALRVKDVEIELATKAAQAWKPLCDEKDKRIAELGAAIEMTNKVLLNAREDYRKDLAEWEKIGDEYSKLIDHCTRGLLSKANLPAQTVIRVMEELLIEPLESRIEKLREALDGIANDYHRHLKFVAKEALAADDKAKEMGK